MFYQKKCRLPKKMPIFIKQTIKNKGIETKEEKKPRIITIIIPEEKVDDTNKKVTKRGKNKKSVSENTQNN